jgi:hypothetical protein
VIRPVLAASGPFPARCALLDLADEGRLPIAVATHIAVAFVHEQLFQIGVRASGLWVLADIVPEIEMTLDFACSFVGVGVHLVSSDATRIVLAEIPTTGETELAHDFVAERLELTGLGVQRMDVRDDGENADDRRGPEAGNGCTVDMVERGEKHAKCGANSLGFASECVRPPGIMFSE